MSTFTFPSPIGGVSFHDDLAPSVLFAVLFGLLAPVFAFRFSRTSSRTFVIFGAFPYVVERVVVFSLRAEQAQNNQKRVSNYLTLYIQISWSIGFLSLVGDLHRLLGCLLLNNLGTPSASTILNDIETNDLSNKGGTSTSSIPLVQATTVDEERTKEHLWYGRVIRLSGLFSLAPMITGIASGTLYPMAIHEASIAPVVQHLRYASTVLTFIYILALQCVAFWTAFTFRSLVRKPAFLVAGLLTLLDVICIYRFIVMRFSTTDLTSLAPGSLNGGKSHALFYIFHIVPEFAVATMILSLNVRKIFDTGLWGGLIGKRANIQRQSSARA